MLVYDIRKIKMNKLFMAQNKGGGSFQYKQIDVLVNGFGAQRASGYEGYLTATPITFRSKELLLSQDGGYTREILYLDEGSVNDLLPVSYAPMVHSWHQSWITNANYYLVKEEGDPVVLKPGQTYFTFTSICNIKIDNIEVLSMDNIGKVNATLTNMETGETLTYEDLDCYLYYNSSWEFVTVLTLPKWAYIKIQFGRFSSEMRI